MWQDLGGENSRRGLPCYFKREHQPVANYVYDTAGRMTSITAKINNKSRTYTLVYDNASRRTSQKIPLSLSNKYVTTTYGYDIANRLLTMLQQGPSAQIENGKEER